MASNGLNALKAIDRALTAGWQLHISGDADDDLVIAKVYKPRQADAWTTIYTMGSILDALTQIGETIREVIE
jgi:hypothetical protein